MTIENESDLPMEESEQTNPAVPVRWRQSRQRRRLPINRMIIPAILVLAIAAGIGFSLGLFSMVQSVPNPYFVPVWTSQSSIDAVGLHGPIENDRLALTTNRLFKNLDQRLGFDPGRRLILEQLDQLKSRTASESVIVYISAVASVDVDDQVFLVANDVDPKDLADRIYLQHVLDDVRSCPCKRKLLVLDICWPVGIPSLGLFNDDVASQVEKQVSQLDDPNLLCISSCSPGQVGWTLLEPRRSVFGYFFERALLGAADGFRGASKNGRVSVSELADYLTGHVDEYSSMVCPARQTPKMFGSGRDFDLVACSAKTDPEFEETIDSQTHLPDWLANAWEQRDRVLHAKAFQVDPIFVRQFESAILVAEMNWRRGGDAERIKTSLEAKLFSLNQQFRAGIELFADPGQIENHPMILEIPASLSRVENVDTNPTDGEPEQLADSTPTQVPEGSLTHDVSKTRDHLDDWLDQLSEAIEITPAAELPAVKSELVKQFISETQEIDLVCLGGEIFRYVAEHPGLDKEQIATICDLWTERSDRSVDVKTAILGELAETLPRAEFGWNVQQLQGALRVVLDSQRNFESVLTWNWLGKTKARLDDQRYVIETLFWHPGHVGSVELESRVQKATALSQRISALNHRLNQAFDAQNLAIWRLPQFQSTIQSSSTQTRQWVAASNYAAQLHSMLARAPEEADLNDLEQISKRVEELAIELDPLQTVFSQLMSGFDQQHIDSLLEEAQLPGADVSVLRQIGDVLSTPFVDAASRIELHRVSVELSGRLHLDSMQNYSPSILRAQTGLSGVNLVNSLAQAAQREDNRRQFTVGLLQLAGVDVDGKTGCRAEILTLWNQSINESRVGSCGLEIRERIQKTLLAKNVAVEKSPLFARRRTIAQDRWGHTAQLYQRLSRDSPLAGIYHGLAQRYRTAAKAKVEETIRIAPYSTLPDLTTHQHTARAAIAYHEDRQQNSHQPFRQVASSTSRIPQPKSTEAWILEPRNHSISVEGTLKPNRSELDVQVKVDSAANPDQLNQVDGFFVEWKRGSSPILHRVDLPGMSKTNAVDLFFESENGEPISSQIRLRPAKQRQALSLFVKNLRNQPQELEVSIGGQLSTVTLKPQETQRVVFPGKPPKPTEDLKVLSGPIEVVVRDSLNQELMLRRQFDVEVASPREYVEVVHSRFIPFEGGRNRLEVTLRATRPLSGPDCHAELELDAGMIPGLVSVTGGRIHGVVPADGQPMTLYAENLKLTEMPDEQGLFGIKVDGVPRTFVFRTSFPRQGDPTTPERVVKPSLKIQADPVGVAGPGYRIKLEATNSPSQADINLVVRRPESESRPDLVFPFPTPYETKIGFSPIGQEGDMNFSASVRDWEFEVDVSKLVGRRALAAELMSDGLEIASSVMPVALDDEAPKAVRFLVFPERVSLGGTQPLVISAFSDLTRISSVQVFQGKPESDSTIPPKTTLVSCRPMHVDRTKWTVDFPLPKKAGELQLTAVATNGAGLKTFETRTIEVVAAEALNIGSIVGQVFEGTRRQPDLEVWLVDDQGVVVKKVKTEFDGRFEFTQVPTGNYVLSSAKPATQRKGAIRVQVKPGRVSQVDISLRM